MTPIIELNDKISSVALDDLVKLKLPTLYKEMVFLYNPPKSLDLFGLTSVDFRLNKYKSKILFWKYTGVTTFTYRRHHLDNLFVESNYVVVLPKPWTIKGLVNLIYSKYKILITEEDIDFQTILKEDVTLEAKPTSLRWFGSVDIKLIPEPQYLDKLIKETTLDGLYTKKESSSPLPPKEIILNLICNKNPNITQGLMSSDILIEKVEENSITLKAKDNSLYYKGEVKVFYNKIDIQHLVMFDDPVVTIALSDTGFNVFDKISKIYKFKITKEDVIDVNLSSILPNVKTPIVFYCSPNSLRYKGTITAYITRS